MYINHHNSFPWHK